MPKKYLGQKKFSQSTLRRKDIKEYETYSERQKYPHKKFCILKQLCIFAADIR
jgi:hypothetical protein